MLDYILRIAPVEEQTVQHYERKGLPLPKELADSPVLMPGLNIFLQGFFDLSSDRQIGMGLGPIPWTVIEKYCESKGFDLEQKEAFHSHLRALDAVFLEYHKEQSDVKK